MAISFKNFAQTQTFTVHDFTIDAAQTPLSLIGRGAPNYSPTIAQNMHWLLENFASGSSTTLNALKPPTGQLWFDSVNQQLKVNVGDAVTPNWSPLGWGGDVAALQGGKLSITGGTISGNLTVNGYILWQVSSDLTASGSNQGNALALTTPYNHVTTVAASTGVRLPTAIVGMTIVIANAGVNPLSVYPASGAKINALLANAAYSVGVGVAARLFAMTTTQWYS